MPYFFKNSFHAPYFTKRVITNRLKKILNNIKFSYCILKTKNILYAYRLEYAHGRFCIRCAKQITNSAEFCYFEANVQKRRRNKQNVFLQRCENRCCTAPLFKNKRLLKPQNLWYVSLFKILPNVLIFDYGR